MNRVLLLLSLAVLACGGTIQSTQTQKPTCDCDVILEQARAYELKNDPQAEASFRQAVAKHGEDCPRALLDLSLNLSRNLKFREASQMMQLFIDRVSAKDRGYNDDDVRVLQRAADIQQRVNSSLTPSLKDLLEYTRQIRGFGRRRDDAIPYAERAVELYPDSVDAILLLVEVLPSKLVQKERVELLLTRAAAIEPSNPKIFTTRGWWNFRTFRRIDEAEKYFQEALSVSHNEDPEAWKGLGYVFMERGQKKDAVGAFRKYLQLHKATAGDSEIERLIESLERDSE